MITYFFRKRSQGQHSIEELFEGIIEYISGHHKTVVHEMPFKKASALKILKNIRFAKKFRSCGGVNHITGDINYVALGLGKNTILTIHDISSGLAGGKLKKLLFRYFWLVLPARRVGAITVISNTSYLEVLKYIPFAKKKIHIVYNPFRKELLDRSKRDSTIKGIAKVLLMGTKPNKNIERCFKSFAGLSIKVVIVGTLTTDQKELAVLEGIDWEERSSLTYQEVVDTYLESDILCFPSTYEGFGLPIIEAQVLGVPVITSNFGAMREVAGDGALTVDPYSTEDIKSAIQSLIKEEELKKRLIRAGFDNSKKFHPDRIAKQYLKVYDEVNAYA
ncbi:MAG: glycosyltransferase family 1 protein [Bacteroidota bacterium]